MKNAIIIILIIAAMMMSGCQQDISVSNISDLSANPVQDGVYVSWAASSEADCYYVYRAAQNENSYSYWGVTEKTEFTDITVHSGVQYSYRIYPALKTDKGYERGDKYLSTEYVFTLASPVITSIQTSMAGCTIRWGAVKNASGYTVYRAETGRTEYEHICDVRINYCIDTTYDNRKEYTYAVEAYSSVDGTAYHSIRSNAIQTYRTPVITSAIREDFYSAVITWDSAIDGAEYGVYRARYEDGKYELLGITDQTFFRDNTAYQEIPKEVTQDVMPETLLTGAPDVSAIQSEPALDDTAVVAADETMVPANYYYKIQIRADNGGVLSYTYKSQGVLLDSTAITSTLFVARYVDFVNRSTFPSVISEEQVYADEFEKDLMDLTRQGFVTVTSKEVIDYLSNTAPLPEKAVMLTIDDAKRGVYEYAYPLLQEYGMKAVLTVVGEYADNAQQTIDGVRDYCNWDEIDELGNSGCFELAAGSYYLNKTPGNSTDSRDGVLKLTYETVEQYTTVLGNDVLLINEKLKSITGHNPITFTYPNAARDGMADHVLTEFGYRLLLGDNNTRSTRMNYFIDNAPTYTQLTLLNRRDRLSGTTLMEYIVAAQRFDAPSTSVQKE